MNTNIQRGPYLRDQRKFPVEIKLLSRQVDEAYIDIAATVNARTIGIFSDNFMMVTGESWYLQGQPQKQQTLREVYQFSDALLAIPTGINFNSITNFTRIYGTFFDGTYWQALPYVDVLLVTNQIGVKVDPVSGNIIVTKGASAPAIQNGLIVLEWLSQF